MRKRTGTACFRLCGGVSGRARFRRALSDVLRLCQHSEESAGSAKPDLYEYYKIMTGGG